jgi:hypothetical protein
MVKHNIKYQIILFSIYLLFSCKVDSQEEKPLAPELLRVYDIKARSVSLEWSKVDRASSYKIYYKNKNGSGEYQSNGSATTATVTGLTPNSDHAFWVVAINSEGREGEPSNGKGCTTLLDTPKITKVSSINDITITLEWGSVDGADSYDIYYATSNSIPENAIYSDVKKTSHTINILNQNTRYYFWVKARNSAGNYSAISEIMSNATKLLDTPKITKVSPINDITITLEWGSVDGADSYDIYYATSDSIPKNAIYSDVKETKYTINTLSQNTRYYFWVKAHNSAGNYSAISTSMSNVTKLKPPLGIAAESATDTSVTLKWDEVSGATSYTMAYRLTGSQEEWKTKTTNEKRTTISGLGSNRNYDFRVKAVKTGNESEYTNAYTKNTRISKPLPITAESTGSSILLNWKDMNTYYYELSYATNSSGNNSDTRKLDSNKFSLPGLKENTQYYFWVKAVDISGELGEAAQIDWFTKFSAPIGLKIETVSSSTVSLSWNPENDASGYNVYRRTNAEETYTRLNTDSLSSASYTDTELAEATFYHYKATTLNSAGESEQSSSISVKTTGIDAITIKPFDYTDITPPVQDDGLEIKKGNSQTFQVEGNFIKYQWYLNGEKIQGAESATYTLNTADPSIKSGVYELTILVSTGNNERRSGSYRFIITN